MCYLIYGSQFFSLVTSGMKIVSLSQPTVGGVRWMILKPFELREKSTGEGFSLASPISLQEVG